MGKTTEISWAHHTWSPWHGCFKVSAGCTHCYAESLSKRFGHSIWGPPATTDRRLMSDAHWRKPPIWSREAEAAGERRSIFPSMCDPFEDHPMLDEQRVRMWDTVRASPWLDWLMLTKRPENAERMLPPGYWPNVWLGTSTENQEMADLRIPHLLKLRRRVPVLFLSVEPQIGPVQLGVGGQLYDYGYGDGLGISWVIVGGESGPGHRPFKEEWARSLRDECAAAGIAFHYKQLGGLHHADGGCLLDGVEIKEFPTPRQLVAA